MAKKKAAKKLKITLAEQLAGLSLILEKSQLEASIERSFQAIVNELVVPFEMVRITCGDVLVESLRDIETADLIPVDAILIFPFPGGAGALVVGHSESPQLDKELSRFLERCASLLALMLNAWGGQTPNQQNLESELQEVRGRLAKVLEDTAREVEVTRQAARLEIERVKEESSAQIQQIQAKSHEDLLWDELTLLPNAKLFPLMMSPMLAHARRSSDLAAVMYLEVGRLEEMSETHGVDGERILKLALDRMMKNLREGDIAVRNGQNRILWGLGGLRTLEDTATVAEKMLLSLSRALEIEGKVISLSGSIGISLFPADGPDPQILMTNAEAALEVSRKTVGNSIRFFSKEMNEKVRSFLLSRKELKDATARQEFSLHYQPVVRFNSNEVESMEALIRWRKAHGSTIYPADFLGLSEQIGISAQLDEWMIRSACFQRRQWEKEGLGTLRVSVNLSSDFFWQSGVERLVRILQETGTPADLLDLEIPERLIVRDVDAAIRRMADYAAVGLNLVVDDFGSAGGLMNLSRFNIRAIKLYPLYIRGIHPDSAEAAIVASTLSLAHSLKIHVVAKAVETQGERAMLESMGCDGYQGNFFSPALPKNLLTEFLRNQQMKAAPVAATVEKTQPMAAEEQEVTYSERPRQSTSSAAASPYFISCFHCNQKFDANQALWCQCITADPTVICPACNKCFCRATLDYRHSIWGAAPEAFWERKRRQENELASWPLNSALDPTNRPLVLVVDDEIAVLRTATHLIRGLGYSVIVGHNGEEGLSLAKLHKPDLVISDALMPKMDGREMCSLLKRDHETSGIKAVIMTAFTGASKYKTTVLRDYHFDEQLQKPVEYERLKSVLQRLLG